MSCSLAVDAIRDRTKTVTRRRADSWRTLEPGDRLALVEKGMGLAKGQKQIVLAEVEVIDVRIETLGQVTPQECIAEGFPHLTPAKFILMWGNTHGYARECGTFWLNCRRIEWRYIDNPNQGELNS
jgi:hypothetical protein